MHGSNGGRLPHAMLSLGIFVDKISFKLLMALHNLACTVEAEHHEGCGKGIGCGTIGGKDGCGKDVALHGLTGARVNGMAYALTALFVEVEVVAACGHGSCSEREYLLHEASGSVFGGGFHNAHSPWSAFGIRSLSYNLAAYLYHKILYFVSPQHSGNSIHGKTFGYGSKVDLHPWVGLYE